MAYIFTDEYRTGIDFVDEEHQELFRIVGAIEALIEDEYIFDKFDEIVGLIGELRSYTQVHFGDEEAYMARIGYPGLAAQQEQHTSFIDYLNDIDLDEMDENQQESLHNMLDFLAQWLVNHIIKMDKQIGV